MAKESPDNAIKQPTPSALTPKADWRTSLTPPDFLEVQNKHPDRVYRFINRVTLDKFGGVDRRGWTILNSSNSKGEGLGSMWGNNIGTDFRVGDTVLAFMPKELADARKKALAVMNSRLQRNNINNFRASARRAGVEVTGNVESQRNGVVEEY